MGSAQLSETAHAAVVIPVGHVDDLLAQQLRAVLAQRTPFPFEVLLACNTRDDAARRDLERLIDASGDPRVRIVRADQRATAAHARNAGARESRAEVIAFCDADDEVEPDWLANLVPATAEDVAAGGHLDEEKFAIPGQAAWRPPATPGDLPVFLGVSYAVSANMALRRSTFEKVGGFDVTLLRCEDIALSWDLQRAGVRLAFAPDAVVHYRHRKGLGPLVRQHYLYGRGMSQVLARHPMPGTPGARPATGVHALRPNGARIERRNLVGSVVRRGSIASGRVVGLVGERARGRAR